MAMQPTPFGLVLRLGQPAGTNNGWGSSIMNFFSGKPVAKNVATTTSSSTPSGSSIASSSSHSSGSADTVPNTSRTPEQQQQQQQSIILPDAPVPAGAIIFTSAARTPLEPNDQTRAGASSVDDEDKSDSSSDGYKKEKKKKKPPRKIRPNGPVRHSSARFEFHPYQRDALLPPRENKFRCKGAHKGGNKTMSCECSVMDDAAEWLETLKEAVNTHPRHYKFWCNKIRYGIYAYMACKIRRDWQAHRIAGKQGWPWDAKEGRWDKQNNMVRWYVLLRRSFNRKNIGTAHDRHRNHLRFDPENETIAELTWIERRMNDTARRHGAILFHYVD